MPRGKPPAEENAKVPVQMQAPYEVLHGFGRVGRRKPDITI